jgi:hypothetical protein
VADEGHIGEKLPYVPPTEVERLRAEVERLKHDGSCRYAGPGRGDCFNFVGLPGHSVPGQHDGDDDTVDHYGKPNGWCWHCWLMHQRDGLSRQLREAEDLAEQLRTQLAGCLTAAEGATNPEHVANRGDYGWSLAYEQTLQLHREYDQLRHRLELIEAPKPEGPPGPSAWERLKDGEPEVD